MPGGSAGALLEAKTLVEMDGTYIPFIDLQPNGRDPSFAYELKSGLGECAGDPTPSIIWVDGDVGYEIRTPSFSHDWEKAEVAPLPQTAVEEKMRVRVAKEDPKKRVKGFDEIELGFTEEIAIQEAKRCLRCDLES